MEKVVQNMLGGNGHSHSHSQDEVLAHEEKRVDNKKNKN
jgi:hypothetical protein